ncbi:uncharacterized protein [Ptychodera flava]|uniref:uncharacterized protein n=1 Tax=Ptychodera flava TaxID=63121 RepID=UPI00396AB090
MESMTSLPSLFKILLLATLSCTGITANDIIYVKNSDKSLDSPYCGSIYATPCKTLRYALQTRISENDATVRLIHDPNRNWVDACDDDPIELSRSVKIEGVTPGVTINCRFQRASFLFSVDGRKYGPLTVTISQITFIGFIAVVRLRDSTLILNDVSFVDNEYSVFVHADTFVQKRYVCWLPASRYERPPQSWDCYYVHISVKNGVFRNTKAIHVDSCLHVFVNTSQVTFDDSTLRLLLIDAFETEEGDFSCPYDALCWSNTSHSVFYHADGVKVNESTPEKSRLIVGLYPNLPHDVTVVISIRNSELISFGFETLYGCAEIEYGMLRATVTVNSVSFRENVKSALAVDTYSDLLSVPDAKIRVNIFNCLFENNTDSGLYVRSSSKEKAVVFLTNVKFSRHFVYLPEHGIDFPANGGAITFIGVFASLVNVSFENNYASEYGGSIYGVDTFMNASGIRVMNSLRMRGSQTGDVFYFTDSVTAMKHVFIDIEAESPPRTVIYESNGHYGFTNLTIICPPGFQVSNDEVRALHHVHFQCLPCSHGEYSIDNAYRSPDTQPHNDTCQECVYGLACPGIATAVPGFWGYRSDDNGGKSVKTIKCPKGYCCDNETSCISFDSCSDNREGRLCGRCRDNYSESLFSAKCVRDNDCASGWFWPLTVVYAILYFLFLLYHSEVVHFVRSVLFPCFKRTRSRSTDSVEDATDESNHSNGVYMDIFYYYHQIALLLQIYVVGEDTHMLEDILGKAVFGLVYFRVETLYYSLCPFPGLTPISKKLFQNSLIPVYFASLFLVYLAHKRIISRFIQRFQPGIHFRIRLGECLLTLLILTYISMTKCVFALLHCVEINGQKVLWIDGTVPCDQFWRIAPALYATMVSFPFFLVLIFGKILLKKGQISAKAFYFACFLPLPCLSFWAFIRLIRKCRRYDDPEGAPLTDVGKAVIDHLESPFKKSTNAKVKGYESLHWEGVLIARKLILVALATFIPYKFASASILAIVCVLLAVIHLLIFPYAKRAMNFTECASLFVLSFIAIMNAVKAGLVSNASLPQGPVVNSLKVYDWIETVLITGIPLLLLSSIVLAVVVRLSMLVYKAVRHLSGKVCHRRQVLREEEISEINPPNTPN